MTNTSRSQMIRDMEKLTQFLEHNIDLEMPYEFSVSVYPVDTSLKNVRKTARNLKTFNKQEDEWHLVLRKEFGSAELRYVFSRSAVCKRKVVGTKIVQKVPANTPTVDTEVDIVEWECPSLLSPEQESSEAPLP